MRTNQQNGNKNNNNNNNNRMRGRNRKGPNPLTRTFESNGPDIKIRGTALHIAEKYTQLARDSSSAGDRVMAESYLQHAEHYYRVIAAAQAALLPREGRGEDYVDESEDDLEPIGSDRFEPRVMEVRPAVPAPFENANNGRPEYQPREGYQQPREQRPEGEERPYQAPREYRNDRNDYRGERPDFRNQGERNDNRGERQPQENRGERYSQEGRGERFPQNNRTERQPQESRGEPGVRSDQVSQDGRIDNRGDRQPRQDRGEQRRSRYDRFTNRGERNDRGDRPVEVRAERPAGGYPMPLDAPQPDVAFPIITPQPVVEMPVVEPVIRQEQEAAPVMRAPRGRPPREAAPVVREAPVVHDAPVVQEKPVVHAQAELPISVAGDEAAPVKRRPGRPRKNPVATPVDGAAE